MKKVSNIEILNNLEETLKQNTNAIDYVENEINRVKDILSYNEYDYVSKDFLKNLEYIKFTLYYLDNQYMTAFKKCGGKVNDRFRVHAREQKSS